MAGLYLYPPGLRAVDPNGVPLAGALLQTYLTGTTTPLATYTSAALTTPLSNPVVADSSGLFPPIFYNPVFTYRAQLMTSGGTLIADIDPIAGPVTLPGGSVAATALAAGAAVVNIGYIPLNQTGGLATNLTLNNTNPTAGSAGFLGAQRNTQNAGYTFQLTDCGGSVVCDTTGGFTWTIPPLSAVAVPVGTVILVRNSAAGAITLLRGSGVTLRLAGSGTSKDVSLAQWGMASLFQEATNAWVASGTGIS